MRSTFLKIRLRESPAFETMRLAEIHRTNLADAVQGGEHEAPSVCGEDLRCVSAYQEEACHRDALNSNI